MLITEEQLAAKLKAGFREHIFLLFGDDGYMKRVYTDRLVGAVLGDDALRFFNFHEYGDDADLDEILADADNLPVMTDRTCLLVKDFPLQQLSAKELTAFGEKLAGVPDSTVLLFSYPTLDFTRNNYDFPKWTPVIELFAKAGVCADLSHRTGARLLRMLQKGAKDRGCELSPENAQYLLDVTGDDTGHLLGEIGKLCAYADKQPITREMIDSVVTKTVEASVFDISGAILSRDPDTALAAAFELLRRKVAVQSIIGALSSAYVNLYRLSAAKQVGRGYRDFAEAFGYKSAFAVQKVAPYVGKVPPARLRESLEILLDADVTTKSRAFDPETLLTELICRLS